MPHLNQIEVYYSHLLTVFGRAPDVDIVAIAHMVPNTMTFAPALSELGMLRALLPKPKSTDRPEYVELGKKFNLVALDRVWSGDGSLAATKLRNECKITNRPFVITDIGGYWSESIRYLRKDFGGQLLGVLEGTENGLQRYEKNAKEFGPYDVPIATTARSPLKLPEDYLVASSVVFSIEATLRGVAEILQTRQACVIGYGRVGSAVADILRARGVGTSVFDIDPIKLAQAAARGFRACTDRSDALSGALLVVCATGDKALDLKGFASLRNGCIVASVTSADDEFDLSGLSRGYRPESVSTRITRFRQDRSQAQSKYFDLIAAGNAVNFLDGAVIGPAMQLIEGEKIAAIRALIDGKIEVGIHEVADSDRLRVAEIWNDHFLS